MVRVWAAGWVAGLLAAGVLPCGGMAADAVAPAPAESGVELPPDPAACSACTLRHRNLTRRARDLQAAEEARGDCQIKGDITAAGDRLYHRPGDAAYPRVWVDEAAGERWFCSTEEAEAAGWRGPAD